MLQREFRQTSDDPHRLHAHNRHPRDGIDDVARVPVLTAPVSLTSTPGVVPNPSRRCRTPLAEGEVETIRITPGESESRFSHAGLDGPAQLNAVQRFRCQRRTEERLENLGMGRAHIGLKVLLLIHDCPVITSHARAGEIIAEHTIDPNKDYQRPHR